MKDALLNPRPFADLSVIGLMADDGACGHYRIKYPLEYLARGGAKTEVTRVFNHQTLADYDIIIAQRQHDLANYRRLMEMRDFGKIVLYEVDDDIRHVHPSSHAYATFRPGSEAVRTVERSLRDFDGLLVTTVELAAEFRGTARRTWVVPNCVDTDLRNWQDRAPRDPRLVGKKVIGWAGSITHNDDWAPLQGGLKRVLEKEKDAVFAVVSAQRVVANFLAYLQLPPDRVVVLDPVEFDAYPQLLTQFDIGLAPIINTPFNRSKSNLKLLEYGMWGIPYVASKVAPYVRYHTESRGMGGYLAETPQQWEDALTLLLKQCQVDQHRGLPEVSAFVQAEYSYRSGIYRWADALREARDMARAERLAKAEGNLEALPGLKREYTLPQRPGRNDVCPCGCGKKYKKCTAYGSWGR